MGLQCPNLFFSLSTSSMQGGGQGLNAQCSGTLECKAINDDSKGYGGFGRITVPGLLWGDRTLKTGICTCNCKSGPGSGLLYAAGNNLSENLYGVEDVVIGYRADPDDPSAIYSSRAEWFTLDRSSRYDRWYYQTMFDALDQNFNSIEDVENYYGGGVG